MNVITIKDLVQMELDGLFGYDLINEMNQIIKYYNYYEGDHDDLEWTEEWDMDFKTTKKNHNFIKELINRQNRFMFGFTPTFECITDDDDFSITEYLNKVLKDNKFSSKLLKAEKDCSIGKRVAVKIAVDDMRKKVRLRFVNPLEFVYETSEDDTDELTKIIFFYQINDKQDKKEQRIFKQVYNLEYIANKPKCFCEEGIYNGLGELVEIKRAKYDTGLDFIPAYVIVNGGLSGDLKGESDVPDLLDNQKDYNRLDSGDSDALLKGMFEALYGIDLSQASAKSIKKAPGMFYDIQTDPAARDEGGKAQIGTLSNSFSYVDALERHLGRAKQGMYSSLDIPQVTPSELQGFITSGKGMKGLYWQQIVRCEGKMMEWYPALEWIADTIIKLSKQFKVGDKLPEKEYRIVVTNRYALPDDKEGDLASDLLQVNAQSMSRKDFIIKWAEVAPEVADKILEQIQKEKQMLEDSYMDMSGSTGFEDDPEEDDTIKDDPEEDEK